MPRHVVAPIFLSILMFASAGFLATTVATATDSVPHSLDGRRSPAGAAMALSGKPDRSMRVGEGETFNLNGRIAQAKKQQRKGCPTLHAGTGSECARTIATGRQYCRAVNLDKSGCLPDARSAVVPLREMGDRIVAPPLAVVMPNPRSPPAVPRFTPRATAF